MPKAKIASLSRPCVTSHPSPPVSPDKSLESDIVSVSFYSASSPNRKTRRPRAQRLVRKCLFSVGEKENVMPLAEGPDSVLKNAYDSVIRMVQELKVNENVTMPLKECGTIEGRKPAKKGSEKGRVLETGFGTLTMVGEIIKGFYFFRVFERSQSKNFPKYTKLTVDRLQKRSDRDKAIFGTAQDQSCKGIE